MKNAVVLGVLIALSFAVQSTRAQLVAKPEDVKWAQVMAAFPAAKLAAGQWAKLVDDSRASGGKAIAAMVGQSRASHIVSGGWAPVKADASYAAAFPGTMGPAAAPAGRPGWRDPADR